MMVEYFCVKVYLNICLWIFLLVNTCNGLTQSLIKMINKNLLLDLTSIINFIENDFSILIQIFALKLKTKFVNWKKLINKFPLNFYTKFQIYK